MTNSNRRFLSALSALAMMAAIVPAPVSAASGDGDKVVSSRYFDDDLYEILLDKTDENRDGELNEYELSLVTDLDVSGMGLTSLDGLDRLPNLSWLDASDNELRSVSSMGKCEYLTWLDLSDNSISNLSGLSKSAHLQELDLSNNAISSVSALKSLDYLETLDLSGNKLSSTSSFSGLDSLNELVLDDNNLREIDDLPDSLTYLSARNNRISDFRMVTFNGDLEFLDLSYNEIAEIPNMEYLTGLKECYLNHNEITGWKGGWIQKGCKIDLSQNQIDTNSQEASDMMSKLSANGSTVRTVPQNLKGWQKEDGKTYYFLDDSGTYATGTQTIDGKSYTFDQYGVLNGSGDSAQPGGSGWVTENNQKYYKDENGSYKKGWLKLDNTWYYLDPSSGAMKTGWQLVNGKWYYLDPQNGTMKTGWLNLNGKYYYLNGSGAMLTGTQTIDGKSYTFDSSGALIKGTPPTDAGQEDPAQPGGSGWVTENNQKYYRDENGSYKKGWFKLDNAWYYLDPSSGALKTGWQLVNGKWYYLDPQSGMMKTGWQQISSNWYYLDSSGAMLTGTQTIDGKTYSFNANGTLNGNPPADAGQGGGTASGGFPNGDGWKTENGVTTYTKADGSKATGWLSYDGNWYYFDPSTSALKTGWQYVGKSWYYLDPQSGKMKTGWLSEDGKWYYLYPSSGAMATGWFKEGDTWYFTNGSGILLTNQWHFYKDHWYYLQASGATAMNWCQVDGKWYHFTKDGAMETDTWIATASGNSWCYVGSDGVMKTGWQTIGGKTYYMRKQDGYCLVNGWYKIDGKSYYFYANGQMAVNTTIDGYKVGADGAWIQ